MRKESPGSTQFSFDNSYAKLPDLFFSRVEPTPVSAPVLVKLNKALALNLGLDADYLASPQGIQVLGGNHVPKGSDPIAMAYAGHQFGNFVPLLGDGRAILLGEALDLNGARFDLQLKGCGRTPYSRGGDGRAWIGPVLREYVLSEAMAALNIPTTRALAVVLTGETVWRDDRVPGAVLTRVAKGHIRVGTFEFLAARGDVEALRILADYVIDRFYPEASKTPTPVLSLFEHVVARQAALIAKWMGVGFIHGVMNTDNMSIAGETIDYGPCAFMDNYHPQTVYSYIDRTGRYAYDNQPDMAKWNLSRLASTLVPLIDPTPEKSIDMLKNVLATFDDEFSKAWTATFRAKLGLSNQDPGDPALIRDLLDLMADNKADFTQTFRGLGNLIKTKTMPKNNPVRALFTDPRPFDAWVEKWKVRLEQESGLKSDIQVGMQAVNPAYIPRNHQVERIISAAVDGDFEPFERLHDILSRPFDEQPQFSPYQESPKPHEIVRHTFCGT